MELARPRPASMTGLPLVGILAQTGSNDMKIQFPSPVLHYTYVAGSYVDWVGISGAISVLIPFDIPKSNLDYILDHIQVFLLPGGGVYLHDGEDGFSEYQKTVNHILEKAKTFNDSGRHFPVFGICNGFQAMMVHWAQKTAVITCEFRDLLKQHPIEVVPEVFCKSKFWNSFDSGRMKRFFTEGYAFYNHHCGVSVEDFHKFNLSDKVWLQATSSTDENMKFVSLAEDIKYPFFALQWHPEKNMFERGPANSFADKSPDTIKFLSEIILELVSSVRPLAKPLAEVPESIKPYFHIYHTPILTHYNDFERVYQIPRLNLLLAPGQPEALATPSKQPEALASKPSPRETAQPLPE